MVFLDIETYSRLPIGDVGTYKYAANADIMLLSYCIDNDPVWTIDFTGPDPMDFKEVAAEWKGHQLAAHNANFERVVFEWSQGWTRPLDDWHCTMVLALTAGLPAKLDTLCSALGIDEDQAKMKAGNSLINRFCKPTPSNHKVRRYTRETHPDEWETFVQYCERDAELVRTLWHQLPHANYKKERKYWLLDQTINDRGLYIDTELARCAITMTDETVSALNIELSELTDGLVTAVTQVGRIKQFLTNNGLKRASLAKDQLPTLLARSDLTSAMRRVIEIRAQAGKSSVAKYQAALHATMDDGRLRGSLQFYGARTGRWSGRQLQPQNMLRPVFPDSEIDALVSVIKDGDVAPFYDDPMTVTTSAVRACICAPPGRKLVASDLANIEGRVLAWLAGEQWKLDAYRAFDAGDGPDLYLVAYSRAFGVSLSKVTDDQRKVGKVVELACGYQGAVGAFNNMAKTFGVELPEAEVITTVKAWRKANPKIVRFWYQIEDAAINAVENPGSTFQCGLIKWGYDTRSSIPVLICKLPSGRFINYPYPEVNLVRTKHRTKMALSYMGSEYGKWCRISTYGGSQVENITQGVARDIMAEGMLFPVSRKFLAPSATVSRPFSPYTMNLSPKSPTTLGGRMNNSVRTLSETPRGAKTYPSRRKVTNRRFIGKVDA